MQSNNYIVIQGWMCNELELKGNELLIFALIHGFSQDGVSKFHGGRKYIADTFNITLPTVDKALKGLVDKGYLNKEGFDDFVNPNVYWVNFEVVKKLYEGSKETLLGSSKETLLNKDSKQTDSKKQNNTNSKELVQNFNFGKQKHGTKQNLFTQCVNLIDEFTGDTQIRIDLVDYLKLLLEMRKDGLNFYANTWKGLLRKLAFLSDDPKEQHYIICQSIERGYKSFFPVNDYSKNRGIQSESGARHVPRMTAEDYEEEAQRLAELEAKGVQVRF